VKVLQNLRKVVLHSCNSCTQRWKSPEAVSKAKRAVSKAKGRRKKKEKVGATSTSRKRE
jgi:hypothetical protein